MAKSSSPEKTTQPALIATCQEESGLKPVVLSTRTGRPILNGQSDAISLFEWHQIGDIQRRFPPGPLLQYVNGTCPLYNCHGLTFASRRTTIGPEDSLIPTILKDDGYEEIQKANTQPGDLILYLNPEDNEVEHSGIVVKVVESPLGSPVPHVWSKWGKGPEAIHHFGECPYSPENVQFFRLRKWQQTK